MLSSVLSFQNSKLSILDLAFILAKKRWQTELKKGNKMG